MSVFDDATRRQFLQCLSALGTLSLTGTGNSSARGNTPPVNRGRIYKSVKWGMVNDPQARTVLEKFQLQKQLGFDGVEFVSPSSEDLAAVVAASRQTGLPVHGVVDMVHWKERLSDPAPAVRDRGRGALLQAIRDTNQLGGSSVLLVPGRVNGTEETHDHVWQRSIVEIRKVLPLASRLGVRILIENVWNGFCESADQLRDYIDEIDSPWVGVYFDIGNVRKFGPSEDWIRALGARIVKLDVKDWGQQGGFGKIGDGDVNWPAVRQALQEIDFTGWCTAEVSGGDRQRLTDIAQRMDRELAL